MRFSSWLLSLLVHIAVIAMALKMPMGSSSLKIDLDKPVYKVDLVKVPEKKPSTPEKIAKKPVTSKKQTSKEPVQTKKKAQPIKLKKKTAKAKPEAKPISLKKTKTAAKKKKKAVEARPKPKPKEQEKKKKAASPPAPTPEQVLAQALGAAEQNAKEGDNAEREALYQELAKLREDIGTESGSSGEGSPGSEAMRIYARIVEQRIKSHWRFPRIGIQENLQAVVEVKIDAEGKIIEKKLVSSSGRNDFDNSVLRAVDETGALSTPPGKDIQTIKFTFNLQE